MDQKNEFREWLQEATLPARALKEGGRPLEESKDEQQGLWDRVYQPFVATMQEWIDLNA